MYSFAQRDDIEVVDEPLYGHYLRVSGATHPGREEVIAALNCDGSKVVQELTDRQDRLRPRRLFVKHMAHHLLQLQLDFLAAADNVFLIRDPREMLPSLTVQVPQATLADTGLRRQWQIYSHLRELGQMPAVLDSRELLLDPRGVLDTLCRHLGLEPDDRMLRWQAGPRPEDGVWAPHWYHAVHESTGFAPYVAKTGFPERLRGLLAECRPWYDKLYARAIKAPDPGESLEKN